MEKDVLFKVWLEVCITILLQQDILFTTSLKQENILGWFAGNVYLNSLDIFILANETRFKIELEIIIPIKDGTLTNAYLNSR